MTSERMKPCPFCGGAPVCKSGMTDHYWVECMAEGCCCFGPDEQPTQDEAIALWNKRGISAELPSHGEMSDRGRRICGCRQCADAEKHPCSRALWAASIALKLIEEREAG